MNLIENAVDLRIYEGFSPLCSLRVIVPSSEEGGRLCQCSKCGVLFTAEVDSTLCGECESK